MKTTGNWGRGLVGLLLAAACTVGLGACGSADEGVPSTQSGDVATSNSYTLLAGKAGAPLGVAKWSLDNVGVVVALDSEGKQLGNFRILEAHKGVVSLTGAGELAFDAEGAVTKDTLSVLERGLLDALREDMIASSEALEKEASKPGAQQALEWVAFACCAGSYAGTLHHWWSGGWTQYCAIRQVNASCSWQVHPQCTQVAVARGCSIYI